MSQATLPSVDPTERPTWVRWHIVTLLVTFSFMTWFNRVSMSIAYDEQIHDQHGIAPESMGYVYSAFLFAYMLFMTPGGWFIDRFGARSALVLMGFGSALFCALTGLAGLPALVAAGLLLPALLVIRSIMGVLTAPIYPASSRSIAHWIPPTQRAWANGLVQGAAAVGIAVAFPIFGALIDVMGWQQAFVVSGIVTGLLALIWTFYATNYASEHRLVNDAERRLIEGAACGLATTATGQKTETPSGPARWTDLLRHRGLMLLTLSYAAVGYIEYLFFFWVHYYFENVLHLGKAESRIYATVLNLALAAGMILGGALADRLQSRMGRLKGRALVAAGGMILGAGLMVLGVLAQETVWIVTWLSLALAAVGASEAPTWTLAVDLGGRQGGTAAAICNTGGNAGGVLAPILTPLVSGWISRYFGVSEQLGWQWGISLGGLIGVLGAGLWIWIVRDEEG